MNAMLLDRLVWFASSIFITFFHEIEISIMGLPLGVSIENTVLFQKAIKSLCTDLGNLSPLFCP